MTWDPSLAAPEALVEIVPTGGASRATVLCLVPASSGSVVVPMDLLPFVGVGSALVTADGVDHVTSSAGSYSVQLRTILGSGLTATVM